MIVKELFLAYLILLNHAVVYLNQRQFYFNISKKNYKPLGTPRRGGGIKKNDNVLKPVLSIYINILVHNINYYGPNLLSPFFDIQLIEVESDP